METLESLEPFVRSISRRYAYNFHEIEDMEQNARLALWKELEKGGSKPRAYYYAVIENTLSNVLRKADAKKRIPKKATVSFQQPFEADGESTLEDVIGTDDEAEFIDELPVELIESLRKRYGRCYIDGIKKDNFPKRTVRRIIRGIIEDVEKIPRKDIPEKANYDFFVKRKLEPMLWVFYDNSPFKAIIDAFDGEILPWDFKRKPLNFWKGKRGYNHSLEALKWFCEKNNIHEETDCCKANGPIFEESGLNGMLQKQFNSSPYLAMKTIFPNLKPWQAATTPKGYLDSEGNHRSMLNAFLIEKGLIPLSELTAEETYEQGLRLVVTNESLREFGLSGLLARYGKSTYVLFSSLFPEQILPWTLGNGKNIWKNDGSYVAAKAVRWLFDKYLMITKEEIPKYATCDLFWRVGFSGIMTNRHIGFNSSPYKAIDNAYPGMFNPCQFERYREIRKIETKNLKKPKK